MRYGAFLQIFREIREGMEGKGGKWEFSFTDYMDFLRKSLVFVILSEAKNLPHAL